MHSNLSYLSKLKPHKNIIIKPAINEVWVYWTYSRICLFDIHADKNQGWKRIEPALLFLAEELSQCALTTTQWNLFAKRNSGKIYRQTTWQCCHSPENNESQVSIVYLDFKFDESNFDLLTQTLVFSAIVELNKLITSEKWWTNFLRQ